MPRIKQDRLNFLSISWLASRSSFIRQLQPAFAKAPAGNLRLHSRAKVGGPE
jgi:hypothetical protein